MSHPHSKVIFNRLVQAALAADSQKDVLERLRREWDSIQDDPRFSQFLSANPGS